MVAVTIGFGGVLFEEHSPLLAHVGPKELLLHGLDPLFHSFLCGFCLYFVFFWDGCHVALQALLEDNRHLGRSGVMILSSGGDSWRKNICSISVDDCCEQFGFCPM